jgi:hypothetical protein
VCHQVVLCAFVVDLLASKFCSFESAFSRMSCVDLYVFNFGLACKFCCFESAFSRMSCVDSYVFNFGLSCNKFCCFESAFSRMSCVDLYVFNLGRVAAGLDSKDLHGRRTYARLTHAVSTDARSVHKKIVAAVSNT